MPRGRSSIILGTLDRDSHTLGDYSGWRDLGVGEHGRVESFAEKEHRGNIGRARTSTKVHRLDSRLGPLQGKRVGDDVLERGPFER